MFQNIFYQNKCITASKLLTILFIVFCYVLRDTGDRVKVNPKSLRKMGMRDVLSNYGCPRFNRISRRLSLESFPTNCCFFKCGWAVVVQLLYTNPYLKSFLTFSLEFSFTYFANSRGVEVELQSVYTFIKRMDEIKIYLSCLRNS